MVQTLITCSREWNRLTLGQLKLVRDFVMKRLLVALIASAFLVSTAYPQHAPQRPPWGDVCCGGPCCVKPHKPK
jgi:hypothetical protein